MTKTRKKGLPPNQKVKVRVSWDFPDKDSIIIEPISQAAASILLAFGVKLSETDSRRFLGHLTPRQEKALQSAQNSEIACHVRVDVLRAVAAVGTRR